jgi:hypothetical protein
VNDYEVLKLRHADFGLDTTTAVYEPVGTIESHSSYSAPSAQQIGEAFGEGEYILLEADGRRFWRTTIAQDAPTYIAVDTAVNLGVAA